MECYNFELNLQYSNHPMKESYEIKMINFKTVRREGVSTHVKHEHYYHPLDTYDSRLIYFTCILNPKGAQRSPSNWIWHQASNEMLINDSLLSKKLLFFKMICMPIYFMAQIHKKILDNSQSLGSILMFQTFSQESPLILATSKMNL